MMSEVLDALLTATFAGSLAILAVLALIWWALWSIELLWRI